MRSPRLWLSVLLMSFTALVLHVRGDQDRVLSSLPLSGLPTSIGSRTAVSRARQIMISQRSAPNCAVSELAMARPLMVAVWNKASCRRVIAVT